MSDEAIERVFENTSFYVQKRYGDYPEGYDGSRDVERTAAFEAALDVLVFIGKQFNQEFIDNPDDNE